jgi:hypothetical protein
MKGEAVASLELGEAGAFQLWIIIGIQIVEADDDLAAVEQPPDDTESDESGGAGDENHWFTPSGREHSEARRQAKQFPLPSALLADTDGRDSRPSRRFVAK